jgi:hypothetical protein
MKGKKDARRTEAKKITRDAAIKQLLIDFSRWSESYKAQWMTQDPRDVLLLADRTWCLREECGPELLSRGGYHVVKENSLEWISRARATRPSGPK